jgi:hypothetical protein
MIFDANQPDRGVFDRPFDVCVVGTGPAGVALARRLAEAGLDVALMEARGLEFSADSQDVYVGETVGLDCRSRGSPDPSAIRRAAPAWQRSWKRRCKLCQGSGVMVALRAEYNSATLALSGCGEGGGIFSVELYRKVRLACRDGMSERVAARHFGVSRESVKKMLSFSVPPGYRRSAPVRRPKLDGFTEIIDQVAGGGSRPARQAAPHGEAGVRAAAQRACVHRRLHHREGRHPGASAARPGDVRAVAPSARTRPGRLRRGDRGDRWVRADGAFHVHAFAFFGGVPQSVLYDNDRCLVARILRDGTRKRAALFSGFLSYYLNRDRYGRPGKGNDKVAVEGLVGWARRTFMVPLPRFASWEDFNAWLEEQCHKRLAEILRRHAETIGARLARDIEAMADLPAAPFDACDQATGRVSSQALVRHKTNDYSVPVAYGHRDVWVRGYVDAVVIGCGGEIVARHPRLHDAQVCVVWTRQLPSDSIPCTMLRERTNFPRNLGGRSSKERSGASRPEPSCRMPCGGPRSPAPSRWQPWAGRGACCHQGRQRLALDVLAMICSGLPNWMTSLSSGTIGCSEPSFFSWNRMTAFSCSAIILSALVMK